MRCIIHQVTVRIFGRIPVILCRAYKERDVSGHQLNSPGIKFAYQPRRRVISHPERGVGFCSCFHGAQIDGAGRKHIVLRTLHVHFLFLRLPLTNACGRVRACMLMLPVPALRHDAHTKSKAVAVFLRFFFPPNGVAFLLLLRVLFA